MKKLLSILALIVVALLAVSIWIGPLYKKEDGCECGRARVWYEFEECRMLNGVQLFMRIDAPGDRHHQHEYWDAQWSGQYRLW